METYANIPSLFINAHAYYTHLIIHFYMHKHNKYSVFLAISTSIEYKVMIK